MARLWSWLEQTYRPIEVAAESVVIPTGQSQLITQVILPTSASLAINQEITVETGGHVEVVQVVIGSGQVRTRIELLGTAASVSVVGVAVAGRGHAVDWDVQIEQRAAQTVSQIETTSLLASQADHRWRAQIHVAAGASQSQAGESLQLLLLGDDIEQTAAPLVVCDELDTQVRHGLTIGRLSPDQVAYARARGLSEQQFQQFLGRSRLSQLLSHLPADYPLAQMYKFCEQILKI